MVELPEKIGAGLLLVCQGECLLLRRSPSSGNPLKMGLPGGNADPRDTDLLATALREATEEMGSPPPHTILQSFLTKRGKRSQKHFTVFLAEVNPQARAQWQGPHLNVEHVAFEWIPIDAATRREDLHPVVKRILIEEPHRTQLFTTLRLHGAPSS